MYVQDTNWEHNWLIPYHRYKEMNRVGEQMKCIKGYYDSLFFLRNKKANDK